MIRSIAPVLGQLPTLESDSAVSFGLLIVGIVFISAWLLMRIRKRNLHGPDHPTAREHLERYKQRDGVKNDLEGLMVEIEQLAKRLGAQLDAKSMRLEKLIDDADLRIAQLQQAMKAEHAGHPSDSTRPPASAETIARQPETAAEPPEAKVSPPDAKTAPPGADAGAGADVPHAPAPSDGTPPPDALAADVARLADAGRSADQIARQLGEHVGKVELILALRRA